jgi:hypothetical protein
VNVSGKGKDQGKEDGTRGLRNCGGNLEVVESAVLEIHVDGFEKNQQAIELMFTSCGRHCAMRRSHKRTSLGRLEL